MKHLTLNYKCVIYDWDPVCLASLEWQVQMNVNKLSLKDDQPFYNVLVEDGSHRYVAQGWWILFCNVFVYEYLFCFLRKSWANFGYWFPVFDRGYRSTFFTFLRNPLCPECWERKGISSRCQSAAHVLPEDEIRWHEALVILFLVMLFVYYVYIASSQFVLFYD